MSRHPSLHTSLTVGRLHTAGAGKVRHHVVLAQQAAERLHGTGDFTAGLYDALIGLIRSLVPVPGIPERFDLRCRPLAITLGKQDVIALVAVERRGLFPDRNNTPSGQRQRA